MGNLILLVGKPKTGKTVSVCTWPKPMRVLDFDLGMESIKHAKGPDGQLVVKDQDKIEITELYKNQATNLSFVTSQKGVGSPPDFAAKAMDVITEYNKIMTDLHTDPKGIQTLVLDPVTSMFRLWKEAILYQNKIPNLRIADYGTLEGVLTRQFIPNLKALNDKIPWIILVDHEDVDTNEEGLVQGEFPIGPSRNQGKLLSEFFDEIWRMEASSKGTYSWRTKNHGLFSGLGSRHGLPDPLTPATFETLAKYLK